MFSRPKILFLVSLLFVALLNPKFNPYLPFKFLIFYHSVYSDRQAVAYIHKKLIIDQHKFCLYYFDYCYKWEFAMAMKQVLGHQGTVLVCLVTCL